ncbi:hypothetical protein GCM10010216_66140 [Streptomyces flaveolus]|nr:hypothetical protein GCM10010216_66140 [Streptomyces flaveolus]
MRVIGAIAMRFGTVRPLMTAGRARICAAREAASEAVTVTGELLGEVPVSMCIRMDACTRATGTPATVIPAVRHP